jgi:hypothetical protein
MELDRERVCYNCEIYNTCVSRHALDGLAPLLTPAVGRKKINGYYPNQWLTVALANLCTLYKPDQDL